MRLLVILLVFSWFGAWLSSCRTQPPAPSPKVAKPAPLGDADADGLPDGAELRSSNDRDNFRAWFTYIAERQFYELSDVWNKDQRDCSGLVRFAWREALRRHDRAWLQRMGAGYAALAPDVSYDLEKGLLGEKLFRARAGAFQADDLNNGAFNEFADAATLKQFNAAPLGRDARQAKPGDLLFYFQAFSQKYPHHVMVFLGAARDDNQGAGDWVVYHTGGSAQDAGEVRKVRLSTLARHPNPHWRPVASNPRFLGFFRLKILQ
jgi:hypothetical protein